MGKKLDRRFFTDVDLAIREGGMRAAIHSLRAVSLKSLVRSDYARFAALCRRAGVAKLGARLLNPIVRAQKGKLTDPATPAERAEYAACLARFGVVPEALKILGAIPSAEAPQALLFQAQGLIHQWRYSAAIPVLDRFLALRSSDHYVRLVAKVNLAAALVSVRNSGRADRVLNDVIADARRSGNFRLLGNAFEIRAQLLIQIRQLDDAVAALATSTRCLRESGTQDQILVEKWAAICALLAGKGNPRALASAAERCKAVRGEAILRGIGEAVRDLDRHLGLHAGSRRHLHHVYFGTPFEDYRTGLVDELGGREGLPEHYRWIPGGDIDSAEADNIRLDLVNAAGDTGPSPLLLRLLRVLASDFYQPFSTGALFSELYPDEHFNPQSSPGRVLELIRRLRGWLREKRIPLIALLKGGAFALRSRPGEVAILLEHGLKNETRGGSISKALLERFGNETFTSAEAANVLGLTPRSARRLLADPEISPQLERSGPHTARLYRFK